MNPNQDKGLTSETYNDDGACRLCVDLELKAMT